MGSLEGRVLPAARKFRDLGAAGGDEIEILDQIDKVTRMVEGDRGELGILEEGGEEVS